MKIERRSPSQVMRLSRLGSFHQCRLSFMRQLTRRMAREHWQFERPVFDIDDRGVGHAVYTTDTGQRTYSLIAFAHDLPDDQRSDRVIAEAWDATFTLFDGIPTPDDIARLSENVPYQEAGRISETELTLSRANRSVRLWNHVVGSLAKGQQPDPVMVNQVGYLMRTTAVYGSGKFGAADHATISTRAEFQAPFQAEMLTVYLIRTFVRDLVNHMAKVRNEDASALDPSLAEQLGIGNSTGLGMAPFLINHPVLFNNWIMVREEALARVRLIENAAVKEKDLFLEIWSRAKASIRDWQSEHPIQIEKLTALKADIRTLENVLSGFDWTQDHPWDAIYRQARDLSEEAQELLISLMLEPYPQLVDDLACCMADTLQHDHVVDGAMTIGKLKSLMSEAFDWTLEIDWAQKDANARAWYVSAEKLEPRLGERFDEPIADYEQPLAPGRDARAASVDLENWDDDAPVSAFLAAHPEHRQTVRRAQLHSIAPYSEIRDNTIAADMKPIDMLRAKLSFFGATRFDPRSDRWVRICMYVGAPYPEDLTTQNADFWVYPHLPA
ncbi:MAG: hypothetical protein AAF826_06725 [Pseudomonadota bacterium]